jgi:large subunit ribosomal protein L18
MDKKKRRLQRARRARAKMRERGVHRLCVYRSPRHVYAQLLSPNGGEVLASASTLEREIKKDLKYTGNIEAAIVVGKRIADRAMEKGITEVAFDRSGFKYHGRVKALAEAARENGLKF